MQAELLFKALKPFSYLNSLKFKPNVFKKKAFNVF